MDRAMWLERFSTRIGRHCSLDVGRELREVDRHIGHRNDNSSHRSPGCVSCQGLY